MRNTLYLVLTNRCNLHCPFCFYVQDPQRIKIGTLDLQILSALVKDAKSLGFREISLTGGEPLLYEELFRLIKLSKSLGLTTDLATNGSLIDDHIAKTLKKLGLDYIYISITSQYFSSKNIPEWRSKVTTLVSRLTKVGLQNITLVFVITPQNIRYLNALLHLSQKIPVNIQLQPAYTALKCSDYGLHKLSNPEWQKIESVLGKWAKRYKRNCSYNTILGYYDRLDKKHCPRSCHFPKQDLVIDSNGDIYPCFHRLDLKLGNIYEDKLDLAIDRLCEKDKTDMERAKCFGEHCISLF